VPPRVRGLRPPVQQDQRDRPAAVLSQAQPPARRRLPARRRPAAGLAPSGAAQAVIADHVADCSQVTALNALA
jgi:hypothetical protein